MDPRTARTRSTALAAARSLMLEQGLDSVTHAQVALRGSVGRRTLYRHWPTRHDLLYDTLGGASFPVGAPTGDLRADVRHHLEQLRAALVDGPLATIVLALGERSASDPDLARLRDQLVHDGCEPLRAILRGELGADAPTDLEVEVQVAELEGPLFYAVCVQGRAPEEALLADLVDRVLRVRRSPAAG